MMNELETAVVALEVLAKKGDKAAIAALADADMALVNASERESPMRRHDASNPIVNRAFCRISDREIRRPEHRRLFV